MNVAARIARGTGRLVLPVAGSVLPRTCGWLVPSTSGWFGGDSTEPRTDAWVVLVAVGETVVDVLGGAVVDVVDVEVEVDVDVEVEVEVDVDEDVVDVGGFVVEVVL